MMTRNKLLISGIVLASALTIASNAAIQSATVAPAEAAPLNENQKWEALEQYFNTELNTQLGKSDALGQTLRNRRWLQVAAMVGGGCVVGAIASRWLGEQPDDAEEVKHWEKKSGVAGLAIVSTPVLIGLLYNRLADKSKLNPKKCLDALTAFIQAWPQQRATTPEALCGYFDFLRKRWDVAPNLAFGNAQSAQLIIENIANFINANKLR